MIDADKRWHVGKEIPIAMIAAIVFQTIGIVWWAATLGAKVDNLQEQMRTVLANQFTGVEARGMIEVNQLRNTEQDRRIVSIEERLRELEKLEHKYGK